MRDVAFYIAVGLLVMIGIFYITAIIYLTTGFGKKFYHDILEWHRPKKNDSLGFDGCSFHATCKYCGKDIMQDSQGNWF